MKTMTDEVDAEGKFNETEAKWYQVRPVLLAILIAEVLAGIGLLARDPDAVRHLIDRAIPPLRVGFMEIEIAVVCLALVAVTAVGVRSARESRFNMFWLGRHGKSSGHASGGLAG